MVSSLERMKDMVLQLKEFQGHMKELVRTTSSQMASTKDQILEKCLQNEQRLPQGGLCLYCVTSLVPRPSLAPVFDHLQYANNQKLEPGRPGNEANV